MALKVETAAPQLALFALVGGILSHLLYFIREVRDLQALKFICTFLALQCLLFVALPARSLLYVDIGYIAGLCSSMIIYRLFFHRLRKYPGPFLAKVSKTLYGIYMARNVAYCEEILKLHQKYGDIVRIGPNELSITRVEVLQQAHGPQSRCQKGTLYWPLPQNVAVTHDKELHKIKRVGWERAFTGKSLLGYENRIKETIRDFFSKIESKRQDPIDISLYSLLISFDTMGRVGYSKEWGVVKKGSEDVMLSLLEAAFRPIGKLGRVAWILALVNQLKLSKEFLAFEDLAKRSMDERLKMDADGDIMAHLTESFQGDRAELHLESMAVLIAATDTVASIFASAFYYLARDSSLQDKLRESLAPLYRENNNMVTNSQLAGVKFLNAIIDEGMRLNPPVTTGGPRITPPEGIQVGDSQIPGEVTIFTTHYAMHRSEAYFKDANQFIPERWTTRPELVIDKKAFAPFLLGPFSCVGKQLALMELRMVLAETIWNYDVCFAPGEDGRGIEEKSMDLVINKPAPLFLSFKKRV
ncbi:cytochrome P450 [Xylogone sp. PMI_703]|nr:cytochrome P450 [Xylogone sp. PMI_703]